MNLYKEEWLSHLYQSIPPEAKRNRISLYLIALEGYRRGLTLKFYSLSSEKQHNKIMYSLSSEEQIHYFYESSGDANQDCAYSICDDKALTESYLRKHQVPVPKGKVFTKEATIEEMINYSSEIGFPLVAKPTDGSGGRGVFANIKNEKQLEKAVYIIRNKFGYTDIIIQQLIVGDEIRVYVLEDRVLSAVNRLPANVIGDGVHTINQLIRIKNEVRKNTPHLFYRPIKYDQEMNRLIEEANYSLDSVLPKNERLYLRKTSNVSTGGDPVDITDQLTESQKKVAIEANRAIPGLVHSGVDMILNTKTKEPVVLEVNTKPGIGNHLFPIEGYAKDIPRNLIDFYFPESVNASYNQQIYFDLETILDSLNNGIINEMELLPQIEQLVSYEYTVKTNENLNCFYLKIKNFIMKNHFQGYITLNGVSEIKIVIAHPKEEKVQLFKTFLESRNYLLQIQDVVVNKYDKPIKTGFHVITGIYSSSLTELEAKEQEYRKNMKIKEKEVKRLKKRIQQITNSSSWKLTSPLRHGIGKIKGK